MKKAQELKELRSQESKDLAQVLRDSQRKVAEIRFKAAFRKVKNYKEIRQLRQKNARIWTILAERALEDLEKNVK